MEEEFYATIKLVTGEELVSKVCYMPDEDSLILEHPLEVIPIEQQKNKLQVTTFDEESASDAQKFLAHPKRRILEKKNDTEIFEKRIAKTSFWVSKNEMSRIV